MEQCATYTHTRRGQTRCCATTRRCCHQALLLGVAATMRCVWRGCCQLFFVHKLAVGPRLPPSALCLSRTFHPILNGTAMVEHELSSVEWPVVVEGVLFRKLVELLEDCI